MFNLRKNLTVVLTLLTFICNSQSGSVDLLFGSNGRTIFPENNTTNFHYECNSIALQSDGKVLAAGSLVVYEKTGDSSGFAQQKMLLVRFTNNGKLDTTFGLQGQVITSFTEDRGYAIKIQSDGKIVLVGTVTTYGFGGKRTYSIGLYRYNSNGKLDSSFGTNGHVLNYSGRYLSLEIQDDLKILVAGFEVSDGYGYWGFKVMRLNPNGTPDNSFGGGGFVNTQLSNSYAEVNSITIQKSDKKIILAGITHAGITLVRYNTNGGLDNSFGTNGIVKSGSSGSNVNSVVSLIDGKILVGGSIDNGTTYDLALLRYNNNGSLDSTFGSGGKLISIIGNSSNCNQILIQNNGKVIAVGETSDGNKYSYLLARFDSNGLLDNTFGTGGYVTKSFGGQNEGSYASSVAIQNDGKLIIGGTIDSAQRLCLVRYNNSISGIKSTISDEVDFKIYPNPNNGIIFLGKNFEKINFTDIEIYTVTGEKVFSLKLDNEKRIDISNSPSGLYYIRCYSKDINYFTRFIKL